MGHLAFNTLCRVYNPFRQSEASLLAISRAWMPYHNCKPFVGLSFFPLEAGLLAVTVHARLSIIISKYLLDKVKAGLPANHRLSRDLSRLRDFNSCVVPIAGNAKSLSMN